MAISVNGTHTRHAVVDTQNVVEAVVNALHGRMYLSSNNDYDVYIGAPDGSVIKVGAKGSSTSVWGVSTTGYHDNIQATTDGHVLRRSGGVLGFGTITSSSISDVGTIVQGSGITLTGTLTNRLVGSGNLTIDHADTSSFSKSSLTGATVISNLTVDTYGHITDWTTRNLQISDIISIPNREVVFGTGTGITSNPNLTFDVATYRLSIGVLTGAGTHSLNVGINNTTSYRCLTVGDNIKFDGTLGYLLGVGYDINLNMSANSAYSLFVGQNINVASTARVAYSDIIGVGHAINDTVQLFYTVISGQGNSINGSGYVQYCGVAGYNNTFNSSGGIAASFAFGRNNSINHSYSLAMGYGVASTASNQANFAFANGYRFMADGTTQWMAISSSGYVTINNIPTAASATDILVSNGGVVSTRTVASLGIPVITPAALTKTDDTNVTISLGGTPATALLQGVSLTMGWAGVLAISRGGTGLGSLGTANQLLRVNSSATALEYFTPDWTSNTGTVTSFSAGNLSPLFTTNVATPTTTPALSFNLSNCNQYQVFGRVAAGTGAPSYVTLNPIAFNGLAIPTSEVAFGSGIGIISDSKFLYYLNGAITIGTRASGSIGSYGVAIGTNNLVTGVNSMVIGNNNICNGDSVIISGTSNTASSASSYIGAIFGYQNQTTQPYNFLFGRNIVSTHEGNTIITDAWGTTINSVAVNSFTAVFKNGYRFMKDGTTQWMAISSSGYVTINNIPTAASATDILVSNGGVVSTRSLSSLNIPTALWSDSGGYIEPLSNSWIQLKPVVGKGSVRLSSDNDSGIIEVFNDDSSQTLTIKSDSNDDVSYNIKTGKVHKFNEKVSIGYIPTNTTSTSYLVDNSGVIEKRSLPIASLSTLGVIKIGDTLQIDGNGVVNTYLQDDFVYDVTSTDVTNNSNLTPVEAMSIPLSVGMWEVNIIAGYKFETTSTGTRLSLNYSEPGFTMHGKLAATINSNNNSEITSKTANGMDISSVNTANSEYALTGKIIIRTTTAGDLSLNFLSLTSGSTVTIMQYSAMTARKLNTHAP